MSESQEDINQIIKNIGPHDAFIVKYLTFYT